MTENKILAKKTRLLPASSLFTPVTLSVGQADFTSITSSEVFNIGMKNASLRNGFTSSDGQSVAPTFKRLIGASALTGQISLPKFLNPRDNSSYHLRSYVPLIRCREGPDALTKLYTWAKNAAFFSPIIGTNACTVPQNMDERTFHWKILKDLHTSMRVMLDTSEPFHSKPPST